MPLICAFTVLGAAKPQGSTRTRTFRDAHGFVKTAITHSNRESLMQWRQDIRNAIQIHAPQLRNALGTRAGGVCRPLSPDAAGERLEKEDVSRDVAGFG